MSSVEERNIEISIWQAVKKRCIYCALALNIARVAAFFQPSSSSVSLCKARDSFFFLVLFALTKRVLFSILLFSKEEKKVEEGEK